MGGTGMPQPSDRYLDAVDTLYLQPHGFGGDLVSLWTPENVSSTSQAVGGQILYNTVMDQINGGEVDADNPVVVFGYSQSASISVAVMERLAEEGVSDDLVRFVLIGSPGTSGVPTDLYSTDVYNYEYDPVAFQPTYFNPLATLNAALGFIYGHSVLLSATPEQVASAIELPTSDPDSLASFYMISSDLLPVLAPLQLIPFIGQPLYELWEPVTRILVNLGYGNIENGWPPGAVDLPADSGLFPNVDLGELFTALGNGVQQGISNAIATLLDPDNYQIIPLVEHPSLAGVIQEGYIVGAIDTPTPTLSEALSGLVEFFQGFTDTTEYPMPD
ncbi:PE-PPE domain-containing protein [Mycolicibacter hiberniae]|nr:PE-PPE domain-containing protein [Mycolicibacter hiberniae]ORV71370.1 PE-PPE domain-containing protein [Mycolicibacter hiberniae]